MGLWLKILLIVLAVITGGGIFYTFGVARAVYRSFLTRQPEDREKKNLRYECAFPDFPVSVTMFEEGMAWQKQHEDAIRQVQIENEGLKLFGEYFDFGFDQTVIILAGRGEACSYSYYFAQPYQGFGYNVLCVDNRTTGFSDGVHNTVGIREHRDILAWIRFLETQMHNRRVVLHGICIGSATALYALTDPSCPACAEGMIAEGMYQDFPETFKNHMIEINKPVFPVKQEAMLLVWLHGGHNPRWFSPYHVMPKMKRPILMLYGKEDQFSKPDKSQILYDRCNSDKKIVWFDKGDHSHLRIMAPEKYDSEIGTWLAERFGEKKAVEA